MFITFTPDDIQDIIDYAGGVIGDFLPLLVLIFGILLVGLILEIIFSMRK